MEFNSHSGNFDENFLEGEITSQFKPSEEEILSTLDEPISVTIKRDLSSVLKKFKYVLLPRSGNALLREWDLWGPLLLCITLSLLLQSSDTSSSNTGTGPEFAQVFIAFWLGAIVVTINSQLLGGALSFFQTVCVLGYCIFPLVISLIVTLFLRRINHLIEKGTFILITRLFIVFIGLFYSSYASLMFLMPCQKPRRTALALYPVCLFYFFLAWMVISA